MIKGDEQGIVRYNKTAEMPNQVDEFIDGFIFDQQSDQELLKKISIFKNTNDFKVLIEKYIVVVSKITEGKEDEKTQIQKQFYISKLTTFFIRFLPEIIQDKAFLPLIKACPSIFYGDVDILGYDNLLKSLQLHLLDMVKTCEDDLNKLKFAIDGLNQNDEISHLIALQYCKVKDIFISNVNIANNPYICALVLHHHFSDCINRIIKEITNNIEIKNLSIYELNKLFEMVKSIYKAFEFKSFQRFPKMVKEVISDKRQQQSREIINPQSVNCDQQSLFIEKLIYQISYRIHSNICMIASNLVTYLDSNTSILKTPIFIEKTIFSPESFQIECTSDIEVLGVFKHCANISYLNPNHREQFWSCVVSFLQRHYVLLGRFTVLEYEASLVASKPPWQNKPSKPWTEILSIEMLQKDEYEEWNNTNFRSKLIRIVYMLYLNSNLCYNHEVQISDLARLIYEFTTEELSLENNKSLVEFPGISDLYRDPHIDGFPIKVTLAQAIKKLSN